MSECIACGLPSTKLCDYVLGFQITRTLPHPVMSIDGPMWTCDAPLCGEHARKVGSIFCCGTPQFDSKNPVSGHDTIDRCPLHVESDDAKAEPMFEADAEFLRRQAWAHLRRMFMKAVDTTSHHEGHQP